MCPKPITNFNIKKVMNYFLKIFWLFSFIYSFYPHDFSLVQVNPIITFETVTQGTLIVSRKQGLKISALFSSLVFRETSYFSHHKNIKKSRSEY